MSADGFEGLMHQIRGRRSVRRFQDRPVPRELLERVIEAASWAPSAGNRQNWGFAVVTTLQLKAAMAAVVRARWASIVASNADLGAADDVRQYAGGFAAFEQAPVVVAVSAARPAAVQRKLLGELAEAAAGSVASAAMAAQNLMLAGHALGLGSCCMTGALAASDELGALLGLGKRRVLVCLIALGYPVEALEAPERKPAAQISTFHD